VVDGDTFWLDGLKYRIADIDTPEIAQAQCAAEKALGDRATRRLADLLNAGPFTLRPADRDEDRYGRKLRVVYRDGASLGDSLVAEGLAHRWDGGKHPWC
jgi:micrococcal nuclease